MQVYLPGAQQLLGSALNVVQGVSSVLRPFHARRVAASADSTREFSPTLSGPAYEVLNVKSLSALIALPSMHRNVLPARELLSLASSCRPRTPQHSLLLFGHQRQNFSCWNGGRRCLSTLTQRQQQLAKSTRSNLDTVPTRSISLFSKPVPVPPEPQSSRIVMLESDADSRPRDIGLQLALFAALKDLDSSYGWESIITRWERTVTFNPHSPLLRSDAAFEIYCKALVESGLRKSVLPAARHRETILALPEPSEPVHEPEAPQKTESASVGIAESVLNGTTTDTTSKTIPASAYAAPSGMSSQASPTSSGLPGATADVAGTRNNPMFVTVSEPKGSMWFKFGRFLVGVGLLWIFAIVVLAALLENSGLLKAGHQATEFEPTQTNTVKFSDVHGVDEAKNDLQEIVDFLRDPSSFGTLGGKLPKGVLLTGPPGTGKTMLARAVAGEAGVPFLFASGSDFEEVFVGVGAKRVRELFAAARKKQPAIIFIDELDAIGGKRSARDQQYMKQTLNQLLVEMDGFVQSEGVIVIAATNFPQSLDQALVRPGRFDKHVAVPLPDIKGRVQILQHHMRNVISAPEVDTMVLARGTPGFSGADLQNMVNQAAVKASRDGKPAVSLRHFEWAKDRIVMGAERRSTFIEDEVKLATAYHEAGHALVALYTDGAMPLHKVTCMPRGHALGITSQLPEGDRYHVTRKEYLAEIDVCMGGRSAEELIYGPEGLSSGCSSDLQHATDVATNMVTRWGYSSKVGPVFYKDQDNSISPQKRLDIENEIQSLLVQGSNRVDVLLKAKEGELHKLAKALVEYETLEAEEVRKVIRGERIREDDPILSQI